MLTYSQVPQGLTKDIVLDQLIPNTGIRQWLISEELHSRGGRHFHVILVSEKKLDFRSARKFDIAFQGRFYKCHCKTIRNLATAVEYACKLGDYWTNIPRVYEGYLVSEEEYLINNAKDIGVDATVMQHVLNNPQKALGAKNVVHLKKALSTIMDTSDRLDEAEKAKDPPPFTLDNFNLTDKMKQWIYDDHQPSLILVGASGSGKTQFANTIAAKEQKRMLTINHIQGLKLLAKHHEIILFDDFSPQDINDEQWLALLETEQDRHIRVLHGSVFKPKGMIQIFACNVKGFRRFAYLFKHAECSRFSN